MITVTAERLTASEMPIQIVHRKANWASSGGPEDRVAEHLAGEELPTSATSATKAASTATKRAMRTAACE